MTANAPGERTRSCATELVCHDCGLRLPLLDTTFKCLQCGQGLDIDYDYEPLGGAPAGR